MASLLPPGCSGDFGTPCLCEEQTHCLHLELLGNIKFEKDIQSSRTNMEKPNLPTQSLGEKESHMSFHISIAINLEETDSR